MNNKTNTNYCNQTNLPCYINALRWYFVNALNKIKITKNKQKKHTIQILLVIIHLEELITKYFFIKFN